jgi:hypothetical protein
MSFGTMLLSVQLIDLGAISRGQRRPAFRVAHSAQVET